MSTQDVRFCKSFDGTRLAYAVTGEGTPLVRAPHWLAHLEYDIRSPVWRPWIDRFSRSHRMLRMDVRGCGLCDRDVTDFSFEAYLADLEAVVDAAGFDEPFALFGHSQGAPIAIAYAARHPERVTRLILLGGYTRGVQHRGLTGEQLVEYEAQVQLAGVGWGSEDATYRQMFSMQFIPGGTLDEINSISELQRASSSAENAVQIIRSFFDIDVRDVAPKVRCPTLVVHARSDRRVPFEEGRLATSLIPGARFVSLETANHIPLPHEPAFEAFFSELEGFLPASPRASTRLAFGSLTPREAQVLEGIARGLGNNHIAAELGVSEKTVRNNVTQIFDKLGVATRAEAIVLARDRGIGQA